MSKKNPVPALEQRIDLLERAVSVYHCTFAGHEIGAHPDWCIGCEALTVSTRDQMDKLAEEARTLNDALDAQNHPTKRGN
jgi:hypothetical protein